MIGLATRFIEGNAMKITVNGKEEQLEATLSIAGYLEKKGVQGNAVVERNFVIVKRGTYSEVELQDGDQLEVVQMMAGG